MDDFVEASRAPGMAPYSPLKPLGENSALTAACVAEKPPRSQDQLRTPASRPGGRPVCASSGYEHGEPLRRKAGTDTKLADALIATTTRSASIATFSTVKPDGTSSEARSARMALIPLPNQAKSTSQFHQN